MCVCVVATYVGMSIILCYSGVTMTIHQTAAYSGLILASA